MSDYEEQDESEAALGLPSDSRSIRDNIVDEFTCDGKSRIISQNIHNFLSQFSSLCKKHTSIEVVKNSMSTPILRLFEFPAQHTPLPPCTQRMQNFEM